MMDEKKINNASIAYARATWRNDEQRFYCMDGFEAGVKWAMNEHIKNLWHDASEEPDFLNNEIICKYDDTVDICIQHDCELREDYKWEKDTWWHSRHSKPFKFDWKGYADFNHIEKWCYLSDLFPQTGQRGGWE